MFSKSTCCNCSKNNGEKRREKWEGKRERERRLNTKILMACNLIQILQNVERWLIRWINRICAAMAGFLLEFWSKFRSLTESADVSLPPRSDILWVLFGRPMSFPFLYSFCSNCRRPQFGYGAYDWHWLESWQTNCVVWLPFSPFFSICCFL